MTTFIISLMVGYWVGLRHGRRRRYGQLLGHPSAVTMSSPSK